MPFQEYLRLQFNPTNVHHTLIKMLNTIVQRNSILYWRKTVKAMFDYEYFSQHNLT